MKLSPAAREIVNTINRHRLNYDTLRMATHAARVHLNIKPPSRGRRLPQVLPEMVLRSFYAAIDSTMNLQHQIMLRLLFYTAIRVSELTNIRLSNIDLTGCKIFIEQGKGEKDRYVLFPDSFRLTLQAYLGSVPENTFLFESNRKKKYTPRRIQQLIKEYANSAGIELRVHPHLFRHQMLTFLTKHGVPDQQIQLISGHGSRESLEIYQHLGLGDVSEKYQEAMKKVGV
jgi:site-specific recombinase XerD